MSILLQGVDFVTGVDSVTGSGFSYRVWILLQGMDSLTGCGFHYRAVETVDSITG